MKTFLMAGAAVAAVMSVAPIAQSQTVSLTRSTLGTAFFPGSGNSNTNFAITRTTDPDEYVELGLKSKQRYAGDANVGGTGSTYIVQRGYSQNEPPTAAAGAWWNFDFSVDLDDRSLADTVVYLTISFNGANQVDLNSDQLIGLGLASPTDSLLQGSENIAFSTFGFDPNQLGTYDFNLQVRRRTQSGIEPFPFAVVTMQTVVVPLPSAAGMALAGVGLIGMRRRR